MRSVVRSTRRPWGFGLWSMLYVAGIRSTHAEIAAVTTLGACVGLWIRAKTVDQTRRGHAEWRAVFVGLWPPVFWLLADELRANERTDAPAPYRR